MICIPNSKTMMMNLMQLRLENMMKGKSMTKTKQITSTFLCKAEQKLQYQDRYKISHPILEHVI